MSPVCKSITLSNNIPFKPSISSVVGDFKKCGGSLKPLYRNEYADYGSNI